MVAVEDGVVQVEHHVFAFGYVNLTSVRHMLSNKVEQRCVGVITLCVAGWYGQIFTAINDHVDPDHESLSGTIINVAWLKQACDKLR